MKILAIKRPRHNISQISLWIDWLKEGSTRLSIQEPQVKPSPANLKVEIKQPHIRRTVLCKPNSKSHELDGAWFVLEKLLGVHSLKLLI